MILTAYATIIDVFGEDGSSTQPASKVIYTEHAMRGGVESSLKYTSPRRIVCNRNHLFWNIRLTFPVGLQSELDLPTTMCRGALHGLENMTHAF